MNAYEIDPAAGDRILHPVARAIPDPAPGEVVVRISAAALNYRDLLVARGFYSLPPRRIVPLSDGAGRIVAVGAGVPASRIGQRVAGAFFPDWDSGPVNAERRARAFGAQLDGMLAEHVAMPARAALSVPDHLSDAEAATLPCAALTAWHALNCGGGLRPGMTVLLQGSGGVSVFALQFARLMGARVIQTTGSPAKRDRLAGLGAEAVIDYRAEPDWHRPVLDLTGGQGVDLVIDIGGPGTLAHSTRAVRVGGRVIAVGFAAEGMGLDPRLLIARAVTLQAITVGSCEMFGDMTAAIAASGMRPVLDRIIPMAQAADAYELLAAGGHFGKIVIDVAEGMS